MSWTTPTGKTHAEQIEIAEARALARQNARPHSSYFLHNHNFTKYSAHDKVSTEYLMQLNALRRTIANFAFIVLNRDIKVSFSTGEQSYSYDTTKEEAIVISATNDPAKYDSMCGLVLHEASHIKWSKYSVREPNSIPLFVWLDKFVAFPHYQIPADVLNLGQSLGLDAMEIVKDMKFIINVMEDRRIDRLMYEWAVGYRGYYEALYDAHWHTPQITRMLLAPETHEPRVDFYRFHICNMTNAVADPSFLPGLQEIYDLINLQDIKRFGADPKWQSYHTHTVPDTQNTLRYPLEVLPDMIQTGFNILKVIYTHAKSKGNAIQDDPKKKGKEKFKKGMKIVPGDPNNLDTGGNTISMDREDYTEEEFAELMKAIEEMIEGNYTKEALDQSLQNEMQNLERAEAQMKVVGDEFTGKAKCVVYRKLTSGLLSSPNFIFTGSTNSSNLEAIKQGISLGSVLAHKITVLAEEATIVHTRQAHGKLDKRLIHTLGYSMDNVFEQRHTLKYDPIFIHLSLDSSGSMHGAKWFQTLKLATALAKVAQKIRTIDLVISLRSADDLVRVLIAYDSRVDPFNKIVKLFPRLGAEGNTPEGLAYDALTGIIDENDRTQRRKYFINVSDGVPAFRTEGTDGQSMTYSGTPAYEHTRRRVQHLKRSGVQVMSYYVGHHEYDDETGAFRQMYGADARFIDVSSVAQIARTVNQMMINGERVLDSSL